MWWKTWYGAPIAFLICITGFIAHPLSSIGDYMFYSQLDKGSEFPLGRWSTWVRACTDIDMSAS